MNYRIYAAGYTTGYEYITTVTNENDIYLIISHLKNKEYDRVMVIKYDFELNCDEPYLIEFLGNSRRLKR